MMGRVRWRHRTGRIVGPVAIGAIAACAATSAQATTVTIGQTSPPGSPNSSCVRDCTSFQRDDDPGANSYRVPAGTWTLTSWSVQNGSFPSPSRLRLFHPTATPGQFQFVAQSAESTLPPNARTSCPARMSVQPGDILGVAAGPQNIATTSPTGGTVALVTGNPAIGDTTGPPGSTFGIGYNGPYRLNMAATLESPAPPPDTDPPDTTITAKRVKGRNHSARIEFVSDEPCSTFVCKIDKKKINPCSSPVVRDLGHRPRRHRFKVYAVDVFGNADPSPAKLRIRVKLKG